MASKWINIIGYARWAKIYEPDEFSGDERYKIDIYPRDEKEWDKYHASGLQLKVREDAEGKKYLTFRRSTTKFFKKTATVTIFCPPEVTGAIEVAYLNDEGEKIRSYTQGTVKNLTMDGERVTLGNGSLVAANVCVYDAGEKGKGHRLESIKVFDLVEFNEDEVSVPEPSEEKSEAPKKEMKPAKGELKTSAKKSPSEDMNDEIPW